MAGVCFIRLAHLVARSRHAALIPLTFPDLMDAASEYKVLVPPAGTDFLTVYIFIDFKNYLQYYH
jgi:hypothetical protein